MSRRPGSFAASALACAALAALALGAGGCKPKAGAACKIDTSEFCLSEKEGLACHEGTWEAMACKGPLGCTKNGSEFVCDQSVAKEGEACNVAGSFVCTAEKSSMLECVKNRWSLSQTCLGERACVLTDKKVTCDNSIANVDDKCPAEDDGLDYACTPDKKAALVCRKGKFALASPCKGPKACRVAGDKTAGFKVECDDSVANVGDPCEKEGHYACAPDERSLVRCKDKRFVQDDKCSKGKEKCGLRDNQVGCF
jgi:hypothetical protein